MTTKRIPAPTLGRVVHVTIGTLTRVGLVVRAQDPSNPAIGLLHDCIDVAVQPMSVGLPGFVAENIRYSERGDGWCYPPRSSDTVEVEVGR